MDSPKGFGLHPTAPVPLEGESEPQEKLSVYKRAKNKARKIRDSISSKTHSGQSHDDHAADHDEEDELLTEPEAHAAPSPTAMHMSPTAENIKASYGSKSYMGENPEDKVTEADIPMPAALVPGQELGTSQHVATDDNVNSGRSNASLGEQLVEEPQYQAKVTDPGTGGHQAEFSPIQHSFEKMGIYDEPQHKEDSTTPPPSTGSDQFSPSSDPLSNKPGTIPENNQYVPESYNAAVGDHPQDMNVDELPKQQSGYTDKTSSVLTEPDISMPAEPKHELEYPSNVATDHHDINSGRSNDSFGDQFGEHLGEDPNYQAKVTDAGTGIDHEVGVAPTVHSFDKMGTYDEPQHKEDSATPLPPTGSRDQFLPSSELLSSKSNTISDNAESLPESYDATTVNHPQDMNADEPPKQQSDYTEEPSSVSSGISNEALTATSVGASKIGSGGIDDTKGENVPSDGLPIDSTNPADDTAEPSTIPQDTQSVRESYDVAPVDHEDKKGIYDEPESTAPPPPMTTGSDDQFSPSSDLSSNKPSTIPQDTQSVRENYDADVVDHPQDITDASVDHPQDMSVDEPPKQQSGNTDDTSSVFSAVPDKAITSAKNVAASEIGHGGTDESKGENVSSDGMPIDSTDPAAETNSEASKLGYGESESPAGVETNSEASKFGYGESENPAGVETNSEASKLGYGGGESPAAVETNSDINKNVVDKSSETGEGSPSGGIKGYLAEKLRPGEDDRALSKLITGKEDKKNTDEEISNAFHNRNNDEDTQKQDKPVGEVTKSEEEEKSGKALSDESPSPGMVGKLKGWFGYGGETSPSKASNDHTPSHEGAESLSSEGEKKA